MIPTARFAGMGSGPEPAKVWFFYMKPCINMMTSRAFRELQAMLDIDLMHDHHAGGLDDAEGQVCPEPRFKPSAIVNACRSSGVLHSGSLVGVTANAGRSGCRTATCHPFKLHFDTRLGRNGSY